jgi:hypothetical protein
MAVPIDAQPDHVPAGVVGKADAEDREFGFVEGIARAPEERERAALRVDVAGRPVREQLIVAALDVGAADAVGKDFDVALVVGNGIAAGSVVGVEAVVAGEIEEQAGLGGVRIGRQGARLWMGGAYSRAEPANARRWRRRLKRRRKERHKTRTTHGEPSGWDERPERFVRLKLVRPPHEIVQAGRVSWQLGKG